MKAQDQGLWPVTLDCSDPTVNWILNDVTALQTLTLSGAPLYNKWQQSVMNLVKLIELDNEAKSGMKLKLAVGCALTFAEPVYDYADVNNVRTIDMVSRYTSYVKWSEEGVLLEDFKTLNAWQYRYVVGAWRQDSELEWARENVLEGFGDRSKIGSVTHSMIAYRLYNKFGVSVQRFANYYADNVTDAATGKTKLVYRDVTMPLVVEVGAVCGGISKFGVDMAQAFGIPAMPVSQPGHCAFIWYKNGKWALDNDVSGWSSSGVHGGIAPAWAGAKASWYPLMDAAQKNDQFWLTQKVLMATKYKSDMGLKFAILEKMTEMVPQNWGVWVDLIETLKDEDLIEDASDSLIDTITRIREALAKVSNLAPLSSVTASQSGGADRITDVYGWTTWYSKETTAWVEVDLKGVADISSLEIQWWGCSIASDYDILIKGPDNEEWTKVLTEEDGSSPGFNGWSKFAKSWSQDTTRIRLELRGGKHDPWGSKVYFGIRQLKINGVKYDDNVEISRSNDISTVSNLAPLSSVTASQAIDDPKRITDVYGWTAWIATDTTAWVEVDLKGVADISSLEIQWWGQSISSDYDILIKGPDNEEWTKVLTEEDGSSPGFNGWSKFTQGWSQETTKIRLELRDGKQDYWGYKAYFGIRMLVINGVNYGSGGDIDLVDICALSSLVVAGSGTVTVSTSTDGVSYSVIASEEVESEASIALSGVATNVRVAVEGGEMYEVVLMGVRYTVKDLLKIQAKEDLADNAAVYNELLERINEA